MMVKPPSPFSVTEKEFGLLLQGGRDSPFESLFPIKIYLGFWGLLEIVSFRSFINVASYVNAFEELNFCSEKLLGCLLKQVSMFHTVQKSIVTWICNTTNSEFLTISFTFICFCLI